MKTIVVGYDATEPSKRALERAAELAEALKAKLAVVSVAEPLPVVDAPMPGDTMGMGPMAPPAAPDTAEARRELEDAKASLAARGIDADYVSDVGDAATAIVDAADSRRADLIVVGTRHPGFLDRLLSGDVGQEVSRRSHCDVLIVH